MLPRCRRCHGLLVGPQDLLGTVFPLMLLIALAGTSYGYLVGSIDLLIIGLMATSQIIFMGVMLHILLRTLGVRTGSSRYHPACFEMHLLDRECAETDALRREVEEKRERANLQLARLVGREPGLGQAFKGRPGAGQPLPAEMMALDARLEVLERYHRRLDLIGSALAVGDAAGAAGQYEAMGLLERAAELRAVENRTAPAGSTGKSDKIVRRVESDSG